MPDTKLPFWPRFAAGSAFVALCTFAGARSGLEPAWFFVYLSPLMLVIAFRSMLFFGRVPALTPDFRLTSYLGALLLLIMVGFFRGIGLDQLDASESSVTTAMVFAAQIMFAWLACFLVGMFFAENRTRVLAGVLYWSALAMVFAQLGLLLAGVQHKDSLEFLQTNSYSTTLAEFGFEALRWQVPLATGVNGGSIFFIFAALAAISLRKFHSTFLLMVTIGASAVGLALIDSRAALAAVPIVLVLSKIFRRSPRLIALTAVLLPALPVLVVAYIDYMPEAVAEIARARASSYGLFAGRETIWNAVWQYYVGSAPAGHLLFGEGFYGQVGSGLISLYRHLFYGFGQSTRELATLHNVYVQAFVDYGLIGLAVYVGLIHRAAYVLASKAKEEDRGKKVWGFLLSFLLALLISSGTEAMLTPYVKEGFSFFIGVMALTACFARDGARVAVVSTDAELVPA